VDPIGLHPPTIRIRKKLFGKFIDRYPLLYLTTLVSNFRVNITDATNLKMAVVYFKLSHNLEEPSWWTFKAYQFEDEGCTETLSWKVLLKALRGSMM
jgi:hypothetical protein